MARRTQGQDAQNNRNLDVPGGCHQFVDAGLVIKGLGNHKLGAGRKAWILPNRDEPDSGEVVVTGASGGVGTVAINLLTAAGYDVGVIDPAAVDGAVEVDVGDPAGELLGIAAEGFFTSGNPAFASWSYSKVFTLEGSNRIAQNLLIQWFFIPQQGFGILVQQKGYRFPVI